jgi:hypothetical protein
VNEGVSGQGVGLYVADGATVSTDALTLIGWNDASTSDDDVFGMLLTS